MNRLKKKTNKYLIAALLLGLLFHGTSMFFTLEQTYDALIHLFFGSHYANSWFEPWNYKWYTGFTVMGYPPLVHQVIGLLSHVGGLKLGLFSVAIIGILLFITGVYRYSLLLLGNRTAAGYAAILAVFSSSFIETLHLFGQLPSIIGISLLMHALPEIYMWLKTARWKNLFMALSLLAITVTSHHVTPIFGMVFFIFPLIGLVIMDASRDRVRSYKEVTFKVFFKSFRSHFKRIITFGISALTLIIICILPYWINTKNNPITQVPIPHGSRDNFIEVTSSGLVFFLIPWGFLLLLMPYFFYRFYSKRYLFFGLSFSLLFLLGTGNTTPLPKMILGDNAFNILTLDRFTLWGSIMALPLFGEFTMRLVEGDIKERLQKAYGAVSHRLLGAGLALLFIVTAVFTINLGNFRPAQPAKIKMLPIVNFLNQDEHFRWRYLPLGFGDQMAWLSAQTKAATVDGNYHSARRLPELTSRAVERLENSKFRGVEGISSLEHFLIDPEKYHLKYVFSNDKFYDPLLHFTGWNKLQRLENGIMVWERAGISPLPKVLSADTVPLFQKLMWGIIPIATIVVALLLNLKSLYRRSFAIQTTKKSQEYVNYGIVTKGFSNKPQSILFFWICCMLVLLDFGMYRFYIENSKQISPVNVVKAYYDAMDFKEYETAHRLLHPASGKSLEQFMLEISVTDGLLSSYAKLDAINVEVLSENEFEATVKVKTKYVTPLKNYLQEETRIVKKHNGDWYLQPLPLTLDLPPNQLFSENNIEFYNHGRRRTTTKKTYHEDVLKQPEVLVKDCQLIQNNDVFSIVGMLQNIDNVPAVLSVKGTLYNKDHKNILSYNTNDIVKYTLLPKETTPFQINLVEGLSLISEEENDTNPFKNVKTFGLQVSTNVATGSFFKGLQLHSVTTTNQQLTGKIFNASSKNATIPQVLITYYDEDKNMLWIDREYIDQSIRPQRTTYFSIPLKKEIAATIKESSTELCFVNGMSTNEIESKLNLDKDAPSTGKLFKVNGKGYSYISVVLNSYSSNSK